MTTELTDEQREQRRTRTRDLIEQRLTETWPAWRRPGRKPNLGLAADIALDSLGELAAEILVDGTMMRALTFKDGVATLELGEATEMVRIFAAGMRGVLDGHGASNYVEMEMTDGATGQGYTVTVQRRECPTPHQFRQQAEAKVAELEKQLAELTAPAEPRRRLTPLEHDGAWHAIEGSAGEEGADPGTVLNAVLHALRIDPPTVEGEQAASLSRRTAPAPAEAPPVVAWSSVGSLFCTNCCDGHPDSRAARVTYLPYGGTCNECGTDIPATPAP